MEHCPVRMDATRACQPVPSLPTLKTIDPLHREEWSVKKSVKKSNSFEYSFSLSMTCL